MIIIKKTKILGIDTQNSGLSLFCFQSSIDVAASVVLLLSTLTIKDPYQVLNSGILASLECRLWNTEFLLWSLFIASTYHMIMMTVERY